MKNPWVIIGAVVAVLIGGSVWYANVAAERNNEGVTFSPHIKGNPDAAVTLTEYSDLQCPACASYVPIIADVLETYGESIRFEYKHFPLPIHPYAETAARAAEAAGQQGKFFEYHDKLFADQPAWSRSANPGIFFVRYAEEVGLDMDLFRRHMRSTLIRDKVRAELAEARALGLNGTPTFFLNGQRMQFTTVPEFLDQIARAVDPSVGFSVDGQVEGGAEGARPAVPAESEIRFGI